jgi:hypothetical protein
MAKTAPVIPRRSPAAGRAYNILIGKRKDLKIGKARLTFRNTR